MRKLMIMLFLGMTCVSGFVFPQDMMTLRLNGHDYQVENIFSKRVKEAYQRNRQIIVQEMTDMEEKHAWIWQKYFDWGVAHLAGVGL